MSQIPTQRSLRSQQGRHPPPADTKHGLVDLCPNPMDGERHETYVDARVEALHGLHQANVALLDEVSHGQPIPAVAAGDMNDKSKVREHELTRGAQVFLASIALCQLLLLFAGQDWNAADPVQISVEAAERTGKSQITIPGDDCCTCGH